VRVSYLTHRDGPSSPRPVTNRGAHPFVPVRPAVPRPAVYARSNRIANFVFPPGCLAFLTALTSEGGCPR
jgi:hypothetical protein